MKQVKYADNGWLSLFAILGLVFIGFCFGFLFVFNSITVAFAPAVILFTSFILLALLMYLNLNFNLKLLMLPPLVIGFIMGLMVGLNI